MYPNDQQNQTGTPANLPALAQAPAIAQAVPPGMPAAGPMGTVPPAQHVPMPSNRVELRAAEQAKQLVKQYGNDPYRLSGALAQLKARFQADQFQVVPKQVDEG